MTTSRSSTSKTSSSPAKSSNGSATEKPEKSNASFPELPSPERRLKQSSSSDPLASSLSSPSTSPSELCAACGHEGVQLREVTRSFGRGAGLLVIEGIPMWSCPHCGFSYFTAQTLHEIEHIKTLRKSLAVDRPVAVAHFIRPAPKVQPCRETQASHGRGT